MVASPRSIGQAEPKRHDPPRVASDEKSPGPRLPGGLILSLLLHSLPLLTLIGWRPTPVEIATPIPIQLLIEQPPPAPPEPPAVPTPVRGASADLAETVAPKPEQAAAEMPSPAETPASPAETPAPSAETPAPAEPQNAAAAPPPEPAPSEQQAPATTEPPPAETRTAALAPPPPPKPARRHQEMPLMSLPMASAWPLPLHRDQPREVQRFATLTGPAAIRDEYCVRALNLTLRHLDLLPLSSLGGRRGRAVLTIRILGDGTINSVRLTQSSGFSDIDQRIQRMVFAVGQYPPLPPRMPGTWTDFTFVMVFPDALQR